MLSHYPLVTIDFDSGKCEEAALLERAWELLPTHSFNMIYAYEFASGYPWDFGIIG